MPTDKNVRTSVPTADYEFKAFLSRRCSNLFAGIFRAENHPIDAVGFTRRDGGIWLCVIKRLNTDTGERQVIFGHGADLALALVDGSKQVAAGDWHIDKPWPR